MSGVTTVSYKRGGYIVVEGEKSLGHFFIVQEGHVRLTRAMAVEEISRAEIGPGDFFEVESALTDRRRLMTAVAKTDCKIMHIPKALFDSLIQKSPSLVQKIILSFSQRMRKLDHILAQINSTEEVAFSPTVLIDMGKYYDSIGMDQSALLCFSNYLKNYPQGRELAEVKELYDELFQSASDTIKASLVEDISKTVAKYNADQMIFCEGMPGKCMYFIQEGSIKICKYVNDSEIVFAVLNAGDLFGEMALLESKPRSANAIAATNCSLLVITNQNFPLIIKKQPSLITRITTVLAERIWFIYRQIGNVVLPEGQERLFDVLQIFLERQGIDENSVKRNVMLNINPKDLVKHTAMNPRVANATLKEFIKERIISVQDDKIVITNTQYVNNRANYFRTAYESTQKKKKTTQQ